MIRKQVKRVRTGDVIGNNYSDKELAFKKKNNIYMPEDQNMIVTDEGPLSVAGFGRRLKSIHPRLYIHYNPNTPNPDEPFGHIIRFRDEQFDEKYEFICGVGKGGDKILPAQSQFKHYKDKSTNQYVTKLEYKGHIAALEQVINYLVSRGINAKNFR